MNKVLFILLFLFSSTQSFAVNYHSKEKLTEMISFVYKTIDIVDRTKMKRKRKVHLAKNITKYSIKYNLDPRIIVAILNTESLFKTDAYNPAGDYSIAQINYKVWVKEFKQRNLRPLDFEKLKNDEDYALDRMAEILSILKRDYKGKDSFWFARYHSNTKKFKSRYLKKLKGEFQKILSTPHNGLF